jgi:hypothetical protein
MEGVQVKKRHLHSLRLISTPLDEPNTTLVKKALRPRYALKYQDIIGIDVDKF